MTRLVRELHTPSAPEGDVRYGTPDGGYVEVPQDFAFADTVVALDEDIPPMSQPPRSRQQPRVDAPPASQRPPPMPTPPNAGVVTTVRGAFERAKYTMDVDRDELKELWRAAENSNDPRLAPAQEDPFVRLWGHFNRLRTMWSFFEWDRADVMRATWIGIAVFAVAAVIGVFVLRR